MELHVKGEGIPDYFPSGSMSKATSEKQKAMSIRQEIRRQNFVFVIISAVIEVIIKRSLQ